MQDATLAQLMQMAQQNPEDTLTLMALADNLSNEASPEDRLEAVARWAKTAQDLAKAKEELSLAHGGLHQLIRSHPGRERLYARMQLSEEVAGAADEYAAEMARRDAGLRLMAAIEPGHWYAVRFETRVAGGEGYDDGRTRLFPRDREMRLELTVAPLDGGRIETTTTTNEGG